MADTIEERTLELAELADERMRVYGAPLNNSAIVRALRAERRAALEEARRILASNMMRCGSDIEEDVQDFMGWLMTQLRECEEGEVRSG